MSVLGNYMNTSRSQYINDINAAVSLYPQVAFSKYQGTPSACDRPYVSPGIELETVVWRTLPLVYF